MAQAYIVYFTTIIISTFLAFLGVQRNIKISLARPNLLSSHKFNFNSYFFFSILIIVLVAGLRDSVGIDTEGYKKVYSSFSNNFDFTLFQSIEPGFSFMSYLFNSMKFGFFSIFLFSSAITWIFFLLAFKRYYFVLPLAILFLFIDGYFFWTMNGMRQAISISIFTYSIKYIQDKNLIKYIFFICLAMLFHYSAILLLPLYLINIYKNNNKVFSVFVILPLYIITIFITFQGWAQASVMKIFAFLPKYEVHLNNLMTYEAQISSGYGVILKHLTNILLILYSIRIKRKFPYLSTLINLLLLGLLLSNISYGIQILSRFTDYFALVRVISIALMFYLWFRSKNIYERVLSIFLLLVFIAQFVIAIDTGANGCSPYNSVIFKSLWQIR